MTKILRIIWLAMFLIAYAVLVSLQFAGASAGRDVLEFVRIWLPVSGAVIFCLAYVLPREPAVWAAPLLAYLLPAAWFRETAFVSPAYILLLGGACILSALIFRKYLSSSP